MAEKRLEVIITGNAKDAQRALGALGDSAEKSGKRTTRALSGIQSGLVGLGVGAAALGSFKAFEESEKIARQTAAVIKSTGGAAQVTEGHIGDLASEMSKLGGVDDELVQSGANMLLTFTKVRNEVGKGNDIFDQATRAANDYAAATGTDVVNANKMLGKALNDPLKGLTALTRAGVSFTQQQKDQIKQMVAAGDTLGAQKLILSEFTKQYGGSLEANATASGKAQVALENLGESAGAILAPGLELVAGGAAVAAEGLSGLPVPLQQGIVGVTGLTAASVYLVPKLIETASTMKDGVTAARDWGRAMRDSGRLQSLTSGVAVAAAGVGAFTVTLEALNRAADSGIDVAGLSKDLEQLGTGSAEVSDVLRTMNVDVDGLAAAFGQASRSPRDFGDAVGYLASNLAPGGDWNASDLRKAQGQVKDLDSALADAVKSGNADAAARAYQKLAGELVQQGVAVDEFAALMPQYNAEMDRAQRGNEGLAGAAETTASKIGEQAGSAANLAGEMTSWATAGSTLATTTDAVTNSLKGQYQATKQLNDEMQTHIDLAHESVGAALSEREAHDRVQDATLALAEARRTGDPEQIQRAQDDLTRAILGEAAAADEAARKSAELQGKQYGAAESASVQQARLAQLQTQTGFTSNEIKWLSAQLDNAARQRQISIDTSQAISNIRSLIDVLRDLPEVGSATGAAGSIIDAGIAGALANLGRADGGPVKRGTYNLVGERGPELVKWGASGTVIPAHKTKQMLGGTSVNAGSSGFAGGSSGPLVVQLVLDGRQISQVVVDDVNRQARMGRSPLVKA